MLANVFTKSIRDRQIAMLWGVIGVVSVSVMGLAAYSDLDQEIVDLFDGLPEALKLVIGIADATGAGSLILGEVVNLMAPLILGGLAISMGSAAIAGEERRGTFGILLGNPKSRRQVLVSKAAASVLLIAAGAAVSGAGSVAVARAFDSYPEGLHMTAGMTHVAALAVFFGFFALFLGAWTGNSSVASGTATGLLILSFLAAGLLPLVEGLENVAKAFPWYYFSGSQPLQNGIDWGHLTVLIGLAAVLLGGALVGVARRDLRIGAPTGALIARLRQNPRVEKMLERIAGDANVSSIAVKASTESRTMMTIAASVLLYVAVVVGPMYNALEDALVTLSDAIPDALRAMIGSADMGTPEGFLTAEIFSITLPVTLIAVAAMLGGRALAGEEEDRTMDLLLANPVTRSRVVAEKAGALAIVMVALGLANAIGTWLGSLIGGLGVSAVAIFATSLLGSLLGLFFGYLALAISAGTGSRRAAAYGTAGVAFVSYFAASFLPVSANLADWARVSPFYYYTEGDPLTNGVEWTNALVLVVLSAVALAVAVPLFQRRDIRG
jgi:ABC-2 type transport system permease protein